MTQQTFSDNTIKAAFDQSTERFLAIALWVGILLNITFSISDWLVMKSHFLPFLIFRLAVSFGSMATLLLYKRLNWTIYPCLFLLVAGISVQNAYMWSVMDVAHFQQHAFAYIVLFVGAGMLVLWEIYWSILTVVLTFIANFIFYYLNSPLTFDEWLVNGGMLTMTVAVFSVFQIRTRYRLTFNEIKIRMDLELSKKEIESQKDSLEEKNQEITDSIRYAKSIQEALLPKKLEFETIFKDAFVFFQPKDIVSGDFYWIHSTENTTYYVTADCTGHGVPGGFMTMLGLSFLEEIIVHQKVEEPAEILNSLRERIISALNQQGIIGESKDGMDVTICKLDRSINLLKVASANNDVYYLSANKEMNVVKADRQPCGYSSVSKPFTQHTIQLNSGDKVYSFTDGYADQFGGPKGKKFRYKQFSELLASSAHLSATEQSELLSKTINDWKVNLEQVDDILVIGIEL